MRKLVLIAVLALMATLALPVFAQEEYSVSRPGCPTTTDVPFDKVYICGFVVKDAAGATTASGLVAYQNGYGFAVTIGTEGVCLRQHESYFMAPYVPVVKTCQPL